MRGPRWAHRGPIGAPGGNFLDFFIFSGFFVIFNWVLGFGTYSKLFLELLPSFWVPGKPGFVLPGSFRGRVCSKTRVFWFLDSLNSREGGGDFNFSGFPHP